MRHIELKGVLLNSNSLSKNELRARIWKIMEEKGISRFPKPVYGRIPNFMGAEKASRDLEDLDIFKKSSIIKVNPDSPQRPVRASALNSGKILLMPMPRLGKGFILLDPTSIPSDLVDHASTIKGAFKYGRIVKLEEIPEIGLIIVGSVAYLLMVLG